MNLECKISLYVRIIEDLFKRTGKVYLALLDVQEVRWENGGTKPAEDFKFSAEKLM
jgi:hypothetical protein